MFDFMNTKYKYLKYSSIYKLGFSIVVCIIVSKQHGLKKNYDDWIFLILDISVNKMQLGRPCVLCMSVVRRSKFL